jgi:HSP20 family protein
MMFQAMREFERMREWMDGLTEGLARSASEGVGYDLNNLYENDQAYMLQFLAPGAKIEDVSVNFENGVLSVGVKRTGDRKDREKWTVLRGERSGYEFTRSWKLGTAVDADKIEAKLADGILLVSVPKLPAKQPKRIEIKVA